MNEIKTLLLLELRSFYGINKFFHTKDPKYKKRYKLFGIVWIFLIGMIFTYVGGLVFGLCSFGLGEIVPAYLTVISSALIVAFGMFTAGNRIFAQKGYDILVSMPMKASSIVISRFLGHYIADLGLTFAIMIPGFAVYGYLQKPNALFYIFGFIGALLIPAIPLVIATLLGSFVTAVSLRMKNKSAVQSVLMVLFVVGIMLGSFSMEKVTAEQFNNILQLIGGVLGRIYPPAMWINSALIGFNAINLLLFVLVSSVLVILSVFVISKNFHSIQRLLTSFNAKHNYKIDKMESRGLTKALYFKEAKRYFASSIYVTNTIIGPIMAAIMAVALCVVGLDKIEKSIPLSVNIPSLVPFVFSAVFCMMTTTSVSVSMEGKQFWIIKSLPIPTKALLDSKILFNLSLMTPFFVISQIALFIGLKASLTELLWQILIPLLSMLFVTVFGITVNLKFHSFDWEKEETVVKQSLPAALGGFAGFFLNIVMGVLVFLVPSQYSDLIKALICSIVSLSTFLLYKTNNKKELINL